MGETLITATPGQPTIEITRDFDAPRELVFRAYTDPELLVRWLGPRELTMKVDEFDVRNGGRWRFVHTTPDGTDHGFRGVFHGDPTAEAGITQTWEWEGAPGAVALEKQTFTEQDGRTTVHAVAVYQSVEIRDQHLANGMEGGARDSYERLAQLLPTLAG